MSRFVTLDIGDVGGSVTFDRTTATVQHYPCGAVEVHTPAGIWSPVEPYEVVMARMEGREVEPPPGESVWSPMADPDVPDGFVPIAYGVHERASDGVVLRRWGGADRVGSWTAERQDGVETRHHDSPDDAIGDLMATTARPQPTGESEPQQLVAARSPRQ